MINVRDQFPIFSHNLGLVYLDSAASAQKPQVVIDAMREVMEAHYANVHRGLYPLSENLTQRYEDARDKVRNFIGARSSKEVIFTKNATEAINLVAYAWALENVHQGDVIVVSEMEHHSNYLPWMMVAEKVGALVVSLGVEQGSYRLLLGNDQDPMNNNQAITSNQSTMSLSRILEQYGERVKLVAVTQVSNVLGTINPIKEIVRMVRGTGAKVMVDGCQAVAHLPVNVQDLDVDFYAFSGHKLYGPTGIGVLYAKRDILEYMHPFLYGGEMVLEVASSKYQEAGEKKKSIWKELPWKFEAGTMPIVEAVGLGVAVDWLQAIGMEKVREHEVELMKEMVDFSKQIEGLTLYGPTEIDRRVGAFSFTLDGIHAHDAAQFLGEKGVCVRAGHHCAQPLHKALGLNATLRASIGLYSNDNDINQFIDALCKARNVFV